MLRNDRALIGSDGKDKGPASAAHIFVDQVEGNRQPLQIGVFQPVLSQIIRRRFREIQPIVRSDDHLILVGGSERRRFQGVVGRYQLRAEGKMVGNPIVQLGRKGGVERSVLD